MITIPAKREKHGKSQPFWNIRRKDMLLAIVFLLPSFYILFKTFIFPIFQSFIWSFYKYNLMDGTGVSFNGFANYIEVLQSKDFWISMERTTLFTGGSVVLELFCGFFCALLLNEIFKGRIVFRLMIIIPWALLTLVNGLLWKYIYEPGFGLLTHILQFFHFIGPDSAPLWLANSDKIIYSVIFADAWKCTPFIAIILLAGLQSIPHEMYEAAMIDGAGFWNKLFYVTIPSLIPSILIAVVLRVMGAFRVYDILTVYTGDPTASISYLTFNNGFRYFHLGTASAMAWLSTIFMLILISIYVLILRKNSNEI